MPAVSRETQRPSEFAMVGAGAAQIRIRQRLGDAPIGEGAPTSFIAPRQEPGVFGRCLLEQRLAGSPAAMQCWAMRSKKDDNRYCCIIATPRRHSRSQRQCFTWNVTASDGGRRIIHTRRFT